MHLEERVAQCAFQPLQRDQTLVDLTAGGVYLRHVFVHLNIQDRADIDRKLLSIAGNGEKICFLQALRILSAADEGRTLCSPHRQKILQLL